MKISCMCILNKYNITTQNKIVKNIYFKHLKSTSKVVGAKLYHAVVIWLWNENQHTCQVQGLGRYSKLHYSLHLLSVAYTIKQWMSQQINSIFETA